MQKYVILDEIQGEDKYLVGFEDGKIGFITKEFERDSAIDLHSEWKLLKVPNGAYTCMVVFDVTEQKNVNIRKFVSINFGFSFRGAYVPELQLWVYAEDSYQKLG